MRIAIYSDLHLEYGGEPPEVPADADLCILAGDIHRGTEAVDVATWMKKPVILVAGNHEYEDQEIDECIRCLRRDADRGFSVTFLERETTVMDGVRFLGCTLWTDFSLYGKEWVRPTMKLADRCIPDFSLIRYQDRWFGPRDAIDLHKESMRWLESSLAESFEGPTVIITHFAPHRDVIGARDSTVNRIALNAYFVTDCSDLIRRYRPMLWVFGHTHAAVDMEVEGGTRLVSNPRGYPHETASWTGYNPVKLVEIPSTPTPMVNPDRWKEMFGCSPDHGDDSTPGKS